MIEIISDTIDQEGNRIVAAQLSFDHPTKGTYRKLRRIPIDKDAPTSQAGLRKKLQGTFDSWKQKWSNNEN